MITTIKVNREAVDWLNIIKGRLEYDSTKKLNLNDAFISVVAITDLLFLKGQNLKQIIKEPEIQKLIEERIDRFWGAKNNEKPEFFFTDTGYIVIKEKTIKSKQKDLTKM